MPNITNIPAPRVAFLDERTGTISREWYLFLLNLFTLAGAGQSDLTAQDLAVSVQSPHAEGTGGIGDIGSVDLVQLESQLNDLAFRYELLTEAQLNDLSSKYDALLALIQSHDLAPVSFGGAVSSIGTTLATTGSNVSFVVTGSATDPVLALSIPTASATVRGALSSTDWATFNGKAAPTSGTSLLYGNGTGGFSNATVGTGLVFSGGTLSNTVTGTVTSVVGTAPIASSGGTTPTISIAQSGSGTSGYLSTTDWNTFNNKAASTSGAAILYGNGSGGFSNVTVGTGLGFTGGTLSFTGSAANITIKDEGTTLTTTPTSIDFVGAGVAATTSGNDVTVTITGGGGSGGTVTSVAGTNANGFAWSIANSTTTPNITLSTSVTGILKGNGTTISAVTSGTDIKTVGGVSLLGSGDVPIGTGTVTSVSGSAPVSSSGGTTPTISMAAANGAVNGYLTSTDWNTFNGKAPITTGGAVTGLSVGVSPYTYTNATSYGMHVIVSGGGISNLQFSRDGITFYSTGHFYGFFYLAPGDKLKVTYTAAPTMTGVPI